jgi:hypothetical protein
MITAIINGYNELRERCYEAARKDNGKLMGSDAWLRYAILSTDITLETAVDGIRCWGSCYTSQTMSTEPFDFIIPFDALP